MHIKVGIKLLNTQEDKDVFESTGLFLCWHIIVNNTVRCNFYFIIGFLIISCIHNLHNL